MAITVGLLFPALLGFGVLAVDVGNWYVHKRELQTQADAAALAGAASLKYPCDKSPISAAAESYAGKDHNVFGNVPAARTTVVLNQPNFSGQTKPSDTGLSGNPCTDGAVDVKMTEKDVPSISASSSHRSSMRRRASRSSSRPLTTLSRLWQSPTRIPSRAERIS